MSKPATYDVIVRKSFPLAAGETLRDATKKLSDAGVKKLVTKLNLDVKKTSVYMLDVFEGAAVFEVYKSEPSKPGDYFRFYAMKYTRKNGGDFEFGDMVEVERVTRYEAKANAPITKSADEWPTEGWITKSAFWAGAL